MLRKLFWKLKEYRSTGTSIHLPFSYLFFLSANPWSIIAHIVLCKGLIPEKRVSRSRSAHSSQCDGGWDCRETYPEDIPSPLFHGVLLPQSFTLLPRAAKHGISGSSFFSKLFSILSCKCSRQRCVSSPHCSLGCQELWGAWGCTQVCSLIHTSLWSLAPKGSDPSQALIMQAAASAIVLCTSLGLVRVAACLEMLQLFFIMALGRKIDMMQGKEETRARS